MLKLFKNPILLACLIIVTNNNIANGATFSITGTNTENLSNVSIATGDIVDFAAGGTLAVDTNKTLNSITASTNNFGTIDFTTTNKLTITNNIGATPSNKINQITFNADGTLESKGSIYSNAAISTLTTNEGSITLSGTASQTISSNIGSALLKLKNITISQDFGASFGGDVYATNLITNNTDNDPLTINGAGNLNFTNSTFDNNTIISSTGTNNLGTTNIATGKTLTLNQNTTLGSLTTNNSTDYLTIATSKTASITGNINGAGYLKGDGIVNLSGTQAQTINSRIGTGVIDRLGSLTINNTSGVALNANSYISSLTAAVDGSSLIVNSILDTSTTIVSNNLTLSGGGSLNLGATAVSNGKTLTLNTDTTVNSFTLGDATSIVNIASGKTTTITNSITGTGVIKGSSAGVGNILFSSSSSQSVAAGVEVGQTSSYLNKITIGNTHTNGVTFNNDVYTSTLDFTNSSGESKITLLGSKTLNITGDILQTGTGTSIVGGTGATVKLLGTSAQNVYSKLGASGNRIGTLELNNTSGATLNQDVYVDTLTLTNGTIKVAGNKVLDITNAVNLSAKTFSSVAGSSAFGKLQSAGVLTVDGSTNINFDYSNNSSTLDTSGATSYVVAQGSSISGSGALFSDNSYLFDNSLTINAANITTTISQNSNLSASNLGTEDYNLINNALQHAGITSGALSLSDKTTTKEAIKTLKPMTNGSSIKAVKAASDNALGITALHVKTINSNVTGFSSGNEKNISTAGIWGQVFGGAGSQNTRNGNSGYSLNTGGLIFGVDKLLRSGKNNIIIGSALAYNKSNIKGDSIANNNDIIDSYQLVLYNNNSRKTGLGFYNNNMVNFASNKYQTQRTIKIGTFEQKAKGNFDGSSYSLKTGFGYNFKVVDNFLISPNAAIQYFNLTQDSYQEAGAGNVSLNVENKDYDNVISEIGIDLTTKLSSNEYEYFPKISLAWNRNLKDSKQESTISFIGGGDDIQSTITTQQNKFDLGLGINASDHYGQSLEFKYNLQLASGFNSHIASIQYRKDF